MGRRLVILYATKGGLGDVGKFALIQGAAGLGDWEVCAAALSDEGLEGDDLGLQIDVDPKEFKADAEERLKGAVEKLSVVKVDVRAEGFKGKLEELLDGADACLACLGNRQGNMARWMGDVAKTLVEVMSAKAVHRLVILSSMGIGEDFLPLGFIKILWGFLLLTFFRSARNDLIQLESAVEQSTLDYAMVRPMGLSPEEPPVGRWHILESWDDGSLGITIAKKDAAAFMIEEAISPTIHRQAVTLGQKPSK